MINRVIRLALPALLLSVATPCIASDEEVANRSDILDAVERTIDLEAKGVPREAIRVRNVPDVPGMYTLHHESFFLAVAGGGRYLIHGNVVDTKEGHDLRASSLSRWRKAVIASVPEERFLRFTPTSPTKHVITVFTDPSCPHCRRFHRDIPVYLNNGVEVRYLLFARHGEESAGYAMAEDVVCSANPREALRQVLNAGVPRSSRRRCDEHALAANYELAKQLRIRATPTLIAADGDMVGGYVSAQAVVRALDDNANGNSEPPRSAGSGRR